MQSNFWIKLLLTETLLTGKAKQEKKLSSASSVLQRERKHVHTNLLRGEVQVCLSYVGIICVNGREILEENDGFTWADVVGVTTGYAPISSGQERIHGWGEEKALWRSNRTPAPPPSGEVLVAEAAAELSQRLLQGSAHLGEETRRGRLGESWLVGVGSSALGNRARAGSSAQKLAGRRRR
jgi:hypothetical protein